MNESVPSQGLPPHPSLYFIESVQYYVLPFLITFGIFGNSVSGYVILHTKLRKLSSSFYLLALSTNDSIMLLTIGLQWLKENNIDVYNQPVLCPAIIYVSELCGSLSVWLIVVFTTERFVVVKYPLRSKSLCTVQRAKLIIGVLIVFMMIIYTPHLFVAGLEFIEAANRTDCLPKQEWVRVAVIFNTFDLIFTCLIPVHIIIVLNTVICHKVWLFSRIRRRMTNNFRMENLSTGLRGDAEGRYQEAKLKSNKSSYKMTKMLLVVSTVCLCMILPSFIMRFILYLIKMDLVALIEMDTFTTIQLYFQFLYYLTFGINFGLYCISGQNFRRAVSASLCARSAAARRRNTGTTGTGTGTDRTQSTFPFTSQTTLRPMKSRATDLSTRID